MRRAIGSPKAVKWPVQGASFAPGGGRGGMHVAERSLERLVSTDSDNIFAWTEPDQRAVDTVRALAMDAVEEAGSGHPGTAMSLAPAAYLLFQRLLTHDPTDPDWAGRDRFVLS